MIEPEKLLAIARTLRRHGDELQSEINEALTGADRIKELRSMSYPDYLQSPEWKFKKQQKILDARAQCQLCYSSDSLDVHHTTYERRGCEYFTDLIVLCHECHSKFHDKLKDDKPPVRRRAIAV